MYYSSSVYVGHSNPRNLPAAHSAFQMIPEVFTLVTWGFDKLDQIFCIQTEGDGCLTTVDLVIYYLQKICFIAPTANLTVGWQLQK